MGRRDVNAAMDRARFAVHSVTNSPVHSRDQLDRCEEMRSQRLRDICWDERAQELDDAREAAR
jgi:hypothetical protein